MKIQLQLFNDNNQSIGRDDILYDNSTSAWEDWETIMKVAMRLKKLHKLINNERP